eukprot:CAMPEP_0183532594 /NCGR_PEP_ID=MMETSP0371-20130417/25633_1 /TAXON_ID=268820 /ORGANISM="Peridinium aciculiferum, Strain PAER-2" /LENGTH=154 /DNA_ID=CAMNT_0025732741 /DNA_START=12 /DNA_END=473 /DNA_ORIENTATION=+
MSTAPALPLARSTWPCVLPLALLALGCSAFGPDPLDDRYQAHACGLLEPGPSPVGCGAADRCGCTVHGGSLLQVARSAPASAGANSMLHIRAAAHGRGDLVHYGANLAEIEAPAPSIMFFLLEAMRGGMAMHAILVTAAFATVSSCAYALTSPR